MENKNLYPTNHLMNEKRLNTSTELLYSHNPNKDDLYKQYKSNTLSNISKSIHTNQVSPAKRTETPDTQHIETDLFVK